MVQIKRWDNGAKLNCAELNCDRVFCGCFRGTLEEFKKAVETKYGAIEKTNYQFFIAECEWTAGRHE
jgi:hypothetical protein